MWKNKEADAPCLRHRRRENHRIYHTGLENDQTVGFERHVRDKFGSMTYLIDKIPNQKLPQSIPASRVKQPVYTQNDHVTQTGYWGTERGSKKNQYCASQNRENYFAHSTPMANYQNENLMTNFETNKNSQISDKMQFVKQGQRNEGENYFFSQGGNENVTSLYPRWSDGDQGSINCPAQNNSGLRIANDYFAENKHHTNPDYPSDVQTPIHNYFDRNDQRTPVHYSADQNKQMTHNLKEFQTSECLMNDNSSKHMFASGARNLASSGHMNANNFVLDKRQRREKEPDLFNEENVEWADYVCHFEQVSIWNKWSESEKAAQLAMSLRGSAQRMLGDLTRDQLTNYESLKSVLTQRFNPTERKTAYRCEFRNRKRLPGETVADYGYTLKRLASRAFPTIPVSLRDGIIVEQYNNGPGSQEIKRHVQFAHPTSLDRAISLALEFEAFEGVQNNTPRKPKDTEFHSVRALKTSTESDNNTENKRISELEKSLALLQKSIQKLSEKETQNARVSPRHVQGEALKKAVKCYNCNQTGHISKFCPQSQTPVPASSPHKVKFSESVSKSDDLN